MASLLPAEDLVAELLDLGTATLASSGGVPLPSTLRPAWLGATVAGPVFTARCGVGDNLALHAALEVAPAGFVLVAHVDGEPDRSYWGEVMTTAAETKGVAGLVIDGGVRDTEALEAHGFGVFSSGVALRGVSRTKAGAVGGPVTLGDVEVRAGDWVVGDRDGVVLIRAGTLDQVVDTARDRGDREEGLFAMLRAGTSTVTLLGLDTSPIRHEHP
jgi:4-hydroxy-4-methyl-2-oxoglutarate aldolase